MGASESGDSEHTAPNGADSDHGARRPGLHVLAPDARPFPGFPGGGNARSPAGRPPVGAPEHEGHPVTFSSAPGGLGFSRSRRTGVILQTSSRAEATDGQAHPGVGEDFGPMRRRDLSSPERGPVTRHIFTGTESGKLRCPGKGRAAPV